MILKDLALNPGVLKNKSLTALKTILLSVTNPDQQSSNGRSMDTTEIGHIILSPGQQIDFLLSLASHPNILIRQWEGMMLWI